MQPWRVRGMSSEMKMMLRVPGRFLILTALAAFCGLLPATGTPLAVHIHGEKAMFQVLISPGAVGSDDFVLQLMSGEGHFAEHQGSHVVPGPAGQWRGRH